MENLWTNLVKIETKTLTVSQTDDQIKQLEEKKTKLYEQMEKYPENEQELSQEYFRIDQMIIQLYKKKQSL